MAKETTLEIGAPLVESDEVSTRLRAPVRLGPVSTWFQARLPLGGKAPLRVGDALLLWFLLPAMSRAERLRIDAEISPELKERIARAQEIWTALPGSPGLRSVAVDAPVAPAGTDPADVREARGWAAHFCAGIDSTFTALRHGEELRYLVFGHGLDRDAARPGQRAETSASLRRAADELGLPLVEVDTNYRPLAVDVLGCDPATATAAAPYGLAHLLAPHAKGLFVAGELSYREYRREPAEATHDPLLDPWVSSDAVSIRVDGMTHRRHEKLALLRERPELFAALRVCKRPARPGRRCGTCESCLWTLATLRVVGASGHEAGFDRPFDPARVAEIDADASRDVRRMFVVSLLDEARRRQVEPALQKSIETMVARFATRPGVDYGTADLRTAARSMLDRYSGRDDLVRRAPTLLPALASSQRRRLRERKGFRKLMRRLLGRSPAAPRPGKARRFQPCPEPGASLFVPEPWIDPLPNGGSRYAFALWLRRRSGKDLLLDEASFSSSVPIDLSGIEGTPALATALPVAARLGLPIEVGAPVSPAFREAADELQEIHSTWFDGYRPVEISAPKPSGPPPAGGPGVASFFSLGVDSFDTLLENRGRISHLVYIHGFDLSGEKIEDRMAVEDRVRRAAEEVGCELVVLQTNSRKLKDAYVPWGEFGGMQGACAQLLGSVAHTVLVPATGTYARFIPFATNPLTDRLYSTETVEVDHRGSGRTRFEKVRALADWEPALRHLRVCESRAAETLNCGACEKCVRTTTALHVLGALERATTFEPPEPRAVARAKVGVSQLEFLWENLEAARARGLQDTPMGRAMEERLARAVGPALLAAWGSDALNRARAAVRSRGGGARYSSSSR